MLDILQSWVRRRDRFGDQCSKSRAERLDDRFLHVWRKLATQFSTGERRKYVCGADYGLSYNNVRMVKFDITDTFTGATPGYVGLAEVRFIGSPPSLRPLSCWLPG